jgi:hypothetical protein
MSAIPAHVKRKLIDAVRQEQLTLLLLASSATAVDWSAGIHELWELWRGELRETVAPPPRPDATNYHEARDALDLFHRAVEELPDDEPPSAPPKRLIVSIECLTVTLDDQTYEVDSLQAVRWMKVLSEHPGVWLTPTDVAGYDPELDGARLDRLKKFIPISVRDLIDSKTGRGSRLRLA